MDLSSEDKVILLTSEGTNVRRKNEGPGMNPALLKLAFDSITLRRSA
jgi:hypothetical protein